MKPIYAEYLVVAVKAGGGLEWYVLDKEFCFLDHGKVEEAYRKRGYEITIDDSERFGIRVVNEWTQTLFLDQIKQYRVTTEEMREMLMTETDFNEKLAYNPSILIDFDNKIFLSYYAESESFEHFVPDGWEGDYQDFEEKIPKNKRYWIDKNGRNLIGE